MPHALPACAIAAIFSNGPRSVKYLEHSENAFLALAFEVRQNCTMYGQEPALVMVVDDVNQVLFYATAEDRFAIHVGLGDVFHTTSTVSERMAAAL